MSRRVSGEGGTEGGLFIYLFIHSFIHLSIYSFIYSFIHLFINFIIYLFHLLFIYLFIYSFIHSFIYFFIFLLIYLFKYSFTGGLDSYQSFRVLENLKDLASKGGHTVIISIHQPRSSIFTMFDDVVLMTEGEVVYSGEAAEMVPYFAALGYPCPKNFNPAEHVLDLGTSLLPYLPPSLPPSLLSFPFLMRPHRTEK